MKKCYIAGGDSIEQNLSRYKIFYKVTKAGNIFRAAKEPYISQPTISKVINKLEDSFGLLLFTRGSRGVQFASGGEILSGYTRGVFDTLDRSEQGLKRTQEFGIDHLRIGVNNTLYKYTLLPYPKTFTDRYFRMKVTVEGQTTAQTLVRLEQQKIDLGLVAEPSMCHDLAFTPVTDIQDVFATTPNYLENLYLREGQDTSLFEIGNTILLDTSDTTCHHVDEYMMENNIFPRQILEVTTMDLLIGFAKTDLSIAYVIRELVQKELDGGMLVEVPLDIPIYHKTIGLVYHPANQTMALKIFLEFLY